MWTFVGDKYSRRPQICIDDIHRFSAPVTTTAIGRERTNDGATTDAYSTDSAATVSIRRCWTSSSENGWTSTTAAVGRQSSCTSRTTGRIALAATASVDRRFSRTASGTEQWTASGNVQPTAAQRAATHDGISSAGIPSAAATISARMATRKRTSSSVSTAVDIRTTARNGTGSTAADSVWAGIASAGSCQRERFTAAAQADDAYRRTKPDTESGVLRFTGRSDGAFDKDGRSQIRTVEARRFAVATSYATE